MEWSTIYETEDLDFFSLSTLFNDFCFTFFYLFFYAMVLDLMEVASKVDATNS